jgi:hypothetical protein
MTGLTGGPRPSVRGRERGGGPAGEMGRRRFRGPRGKKEGEGGWAGGLGWERVWVSLFFLFLKPLLNSFQIQTFNIFLTELFHKFSQTFKDF